MSTAPASEPERIAKRLARAGIASRRDAEKMILEGRISVDGKTLTSPALNVTEKSVILVDGEPLRVKEPTRLWRFHKEPGSITTSRDPKGRTTIFERLPADLPRTVTVGRLDFNTEGLLLLTNDGGLARFLELPKNAWLRHYRVRVHGTPDEKRLNALKDGVTIAGIHYEAVRARVEKQQGANCWIDVSIKEGKNREIRKIMDYLDLPVTRLIRTAFGPFQLGALAKGATEEVPQRVLKEHMKRYFETGGV